MATVCVRYWAGAKRAAGVATESIDAATVGQLRALLSQRRELTAVVAAASYLVDGGRAGDDTPLADGATVDILPPFAGG